MYICIIHTHTHTHTHTRTNMYVCMYIYIRETYYVTFPSCGLQRGGFQNKGDTVCMKPARDWTWTCLLGMHYTLPSNYSGKNRAGTAYTYRQMQLCPPRTFHTLCLYRRKIRWTSTLHSCYHCRKKIIASQNSCYSCTIFSNIFSNMSRLWEALVTCPREPLPCRIWFVPFHLP